MGDRFVVLKVSGSRFAYVQDTQERKTVKRYDVLRRYGKHDGWTCAKNHAETLNKVSGISGLLPPIDAPEVPNV